MNRASLLKIVLVVVGILFVALAYPMVLFVREEPALAMMLSLYVTLGVFLLLAARNPAAHRSLIAFTAWSSLVHGGLMVIQVSLHMIDKVELIGTGVLLVIGVALLLLAPPQLSLDPASART
jgi:drug/metabolite transporter superfamily protein YnfA